MANGKWTDFIHAGDQLACIPEAGSAFENNTSFSSKFRMADKNGNYRYFMAKGILHLNQDGQPGGYVISCTDSTEQHNEIQRENDFLSMISHELKTPLTSLSGFIEMIQDTAKENDPGSFSTIALEKSLSQARRLTRTINDFLSLSRLDAAKIQIEKHPFQLEDLVREVVSEKSSLRGNYPIGIVMCQPVLLNADRSKLTIVLLNLLSNAIKFSINRYLVEIVYFVAGNQVTCSVSEKGIGISSENHSEFSTGTLR